MTRNGGETYGGEQLVMRRNRVVNITFGRVPIALARCSLTPRDTEPLVDSWSACWARASSTRGHPQQVFVVLVYGRVLRTAYESDSVACQRFCALLERCRRSLQIP